MKQLLFISAIVIFSTSGYVAGQQEPSKKQDPPKKDLYEFKKDHDPNGIGKFYMGREIANVMGYAGGQGPAWLERPEREKEEKVSKLMPSLEVKPGQVVADFGAGSGHHTFRLSKLVGEK